MQAFMSQPVSLPSRFFRGGLRKRLARMRFSRFLLSETNSRLRQHGPLLSGAHSVFAISSSAVFAVPVGKSMKTPFLRSASLLAVLANGQHPADKLIAFFTSPVSRWARCHSKGRSTHVQPEEVQVELIQPELTKLNSWLTISLFTIFLPLSFYLNGTTQHIIEELENYNFQNQVLSPIVLFSPLSTAFNETPRFPLSVPHARIESKHDVEIEAIQSDDSPPFRVSSAFTCRDDVRETDKPYGQADMCDVSTETKLAEATRSFGFKTFSKTELLQLCPACLPRRGGNRSHELRVAILKHARRNGTPLDPKAITRRRYISPVGLGMINSKRARRLPRPFGGITTDLHI
ncbi:hypothetical protein CCUS01_07751 [Colletotrichum cuscutae]|uniref:Uncharacterized protein n=1 Tax=Colletotrichum cuscutae TaxID=1209917 RepID=A0AAI9UYF7_9PEZI|nr:hypothetical protein CCUS01_07751 [Colletotrichum cuscutae]